MKRPHVILWGTLIHGSIHSGLLVKPASCVSHERKIWMYGLQYLTPPPLFPPIRLWSPWDCAEITLQHSQLPVSGSAQSSGRSIFPGISWASRFTQKHTSMCVYTCWLLEPAVTKQLIHSPWSCVAFIECSMSTSFNNVGGSDNVVWILLQKCHFHF